MGSWFSPAIYMSKWWSKGLWRARFIAFRKQLCGTRSLAFLVCTLTALLTLDLCVKLIIRKQQVWLRLTEVPVQSLLTKALRRAPVKILEKKVYKFQLYESEFGITELTFCQMAFPFSTRDGFTLEALTFVILHDPKFSIEFQKQQGLQNVTCWFILKAVPSIPSFLRHTLPFIITCYNYTSFKERTVSWQCHTHQVSTRLCFLMQKTRELLK